MQHYWIHQLREVEEPWAVHVVMLKSGFMDVKVYAEYLRGRFCTYIGLGQTRAQLMNAVKDAVLVSANPRQTWAQMDTDQIEDFWDNVIAPNIENR